MRIRSFIQHNFRTIKPEDYLINQHEAMLVRQAHIKTLDVLQKANQGDNLITDQVWLVGVPHGQPKQRYYRTDIFQQLTSQTDCDLIFLQIDPSAYMARQRFMAHRCAMNGVEDYRLDGIHLIDPHQPITWQETVINLLTMDMISSNSLPHQLNYNLGMYAYSYHYLQEEHNRKQLTPHFIEEISQHVLEGKRTGFNAIDQMLYTSLMGKHKVMLGGMPETLFRIILGQSLTIHELRDLFRTIVLKNKQLTLPMSIKTATQCFMPHIFLLPKDLYMTAIMKQAFQAAVQMFSLVGIEHWRPIQQYWVGPPHGINMTEATRIPNGFEDQTTQNQIEKQAIMDVLLESRIWSKGYLSNPFPYLFEDITKVDKKQLQNYKKLFMFHYKKYSQFLKRQTKMLPKNQVLLQLEQIKLSKEQMSKIKDTLGQQPSLSHLKKKDQMEGLRLKLQKQ